MIMNIKEQICAEIERLQEMYLVRQDEFKADDVELSIFYEGKAKMCGEFLAFIDSLPEKPVEGLDEAAESHTFYAAQQPGQDWETHDVTDAFKAGAEWMKAKMMKEAAKK